MQRIGFGYDVHRLETGLPLRIGGVDLPDAPSGAVAHSDGDVLIHAICDALLGAVGLGDIGEHFPDTDPAYRGIVSIELLARVVEILGTAGYAIGNVDSMVILERPKIAPYREAMRQLIARTLGIDTDRVSVKATTAEGMGDVGRGISIVAHAVALVVPTTS